MSGNINDPSMFMANNAKGIPIQDTNKLTNHVYANIIMKNSTSKAIAAQYEATQNVPLLGHQEDFEMRVARLKVPLDGMPLFMFNKALAGTPQDYQVGIANVEPAWELLGTQNLTALPTTWQYLEPVEYKYARNYRGDLECAVWAEEHFLMMVNDALRGAWTQAIVDGVIPNEVSGRFPYFQHNTATNLIELVMPFDDTNSDTWLWPRREQGDGGITIVMSPELFSFFNGFSSWHNEQDNFDPTGLYLHYFLLNAIPNDILTLPPQGPITGGTYQVIPQEHSSIFAFHRANRVIVATSMALVKESVLVNDLDGKTRRIEVLTDFEIPQAGNPKEYIYYNDQGNNRFMNIKDEGALRRVNLDIYIEFEDGTIIQNRLLPGRDANIKLEFRRKKVNSKYQVSDGSRHTL